MCLPMCLKSCDNVREQYCGGRMNRGMGQYFTLPEMDFSLYRENHFAIGVQVTLFYSLNVFVLKVIRYFGPKCKFVNC